MIERWQRHPSLRVEASTAGNVRRLNGARARVFHNDKGYAWVNVQRRVVGVGVLILETFVCARPNGCEADHINGDRTDNRLANLRWLSFAENRSHFGPDNHATKLTADDVREIRRRASEGTPKLRMAREYGVDEKSIRLIVRRETWKQIT